MLNLSRDVGLITGAAVMGAVFAFASATTDLGTARAQGMVSGMRVTLVVAALLVLVALGVALLGRAVARRTVLRGA